MISHMISYEIIGTSLSQRKDNNVMDDIM
jgi:hypothetical protein